VRLNGNWHQLCAGQAAVWCRRVLLQEDVVIQPRSEADVATKVVFRDLLSVIPQKQSVWITDPENKQLRNGLLISRTLVPNQEINVPVRVLNVTDKPIKLKADTMIANLQQGTVLAEPEDSSTGLIVPSPLDQIVDGVDSSVENRYRRELRQLLQKYQVAFSVTEQDVGRTNMATHCIDTGNGRPVRQALRRHPPAHESAIRQQVDELLQQGIIEPTSSPWASNVVLVKKKDGSLRMCATIDKSTPFLGKMHTQFPGQTFVWTLCRDQFGSRPLTYVARTTRCILIPLMRIRQRLFAVVVCFGTERCRSVCVELEPRFNGLWT